MPRNSAVLFIFKPKYLENYAIYVIDQWRKINQLKCQLIVIASAQRCLKETWQLLTLTFLQNFTLNVLFANLRAGIDEILCDF
jgi:hypothetical protein